MNDSIDAMYDVILEEPRTVRKRQLDLLVLDHESPLLSCPSHKQLVHGVAVGLRRLGISTLRLTRSTQHTQADPLDVVAQQLSLFRQSAFAASGVQ